MGRDSSVGIATQYGLDGPGFESRWGDETSLPVQISSEAHPVPYTVNFIFFTRYFLEVKQGMLGRA